ncbi:hypothetical protein C8N46_11361 [Kordia periserrulae]|uniref:Uncharacterized protein n=1 Tax=Kordia periserrulae TaxID=701523 RepID=A0A2T6BR62_9FLAO|nr:hypothetical protein [Kordia periserrulae]PTX58570.1 hypothetical protein C8N46_11361 [Kordia periserrulae]
MSYSAVLKSINESSEAICEDEKTRKIASNCAPHIVSATVGAITGDSTIGEAAGRVTKVYAQSNEKKVAEAVVGIGLAIAIPALSILATPVFLAAMIFDD